MSVQQTKKDGRKVGINSRPDGDEVVEKDDEGEDVRKGLEDLVVENIGGVDKVPRIKSVGVHPHKIGHGAEDCQEEQDEEEEDDLVIGEPLHSSPLDWGGTFKEQKEEEEKKERRKKKEERSQEIKRGHRNWSAHTWHSGRVWYRSQ